MIELKHIVKKYGSKRALQDVTVSIPRGKVIGLVGENGSGKSTLLKMMAGLLTANSGSAAFDGQPITRRIASRVAYMSDTDDFYTYFTVQQLIDFYESQFEDFDMVKAKEIVQFLNVSLTSRIKSLSKGNRGRVKIAVTLAREADYYLLDEPFSGLDPMVREDIAKGLIRFTDPERQSVIMSTHEIREVEPLLDEIIVMRGGRLIAHEAVDEIRDFYGIDATSWMVSLFKDSQVERELGK
ncbi:ABC transporter ATP-binding protein [Sporosarcina luteola]|uniref:ABC transporter ATP-binding protein n=1 Tax=Bacillales TaxID=1385 RepID=UPI00203A5D9D|nr:MULTISPECIES: ABC transporter ATP-binding protein [Bacillales]MCM3638635.1 ABC transporter ATP-binding protein [Sporosarcina luteola]